MAADTSLPRSYKFFYVKRTPDGFLHAAQQINKNTTFPGYNPIEGDWCLVVAPTGICVNGDYGTNPPLEEMREMADLMREAVEAFDHVSGESEIARLRADVDAANARAAAAEAERDALREKLRMWWGSELSDFSSAETIVKLQGILNDNAVTAQPADGIAAEWTPKIGDRVQVRETGAFYTVKGTKEHWGVAYVLVDESGREEEDIYYDFELQSAD